MKRSTSPPGSTGHRILAVHDTSVGMTEAHDSAYLVDATNDIARRAITPLAPVDVTAHRPVVEGAGWRPNQPAA